MDPQSTPGCALDHQLLFETAPAALLVLAPDQPRFTILAASEAYLRATKTCRDILGRGIFEVFPEDPDVRASFERVLETRAPDTMAVQEHSIERPDSEGGGFEERYWSAVNTPVLGAGGEVLYLHHRLDDVTELVRQRQKGLEQDALRAQEALRDSDVRYKTLFDSIDEGFCIVEVLLDDAGRPNTIASSR